MEQFEGFYAEFDTPSKKEGAQMMGADDLVGAPYSVALKVQDGKSVAWLTNQFGAERGFLGDKDSQRVQLALARGWKVQARLAFVAYSDAPDPGHYWGEMAVFCFAPTVAEKVEVFAAGVGRQLGEGVRPKIDLGAGAVKKMLADPSWLPNERVPLPKKQKGTAVFKDHLTMSDKMVEQGRARNKGCYVVSWAFIVLVVGLLVWGALKLFGIL